MKEGIFQKEIKIGILGGGQLGKMLLQAANPWNMSIYILDSSNTFPAANMCDHFVEGSFKNYDDVYNFGKLVDILTIEIEHVNTDALLQLEKEGVIVHPSPSQLNIIKDKGLQKLFYQKNNLPSSSFQLFEDDKSIQKAIRAGDLQFPFVQKSRTAGYDGKGVVVIKNENDLAKIFPVKSIVEPLVDIDKELAVIVAKNENGQIEAFPPVEMVFDPVANLVDYLICPAKINEEIATKAMNLAKEVIKTFDICGLLAVELFLSKNGKILINEVAPRPHNSGHHTIESSITSQFQQHLRAICNMPLGDTGSILPAVMLNLLGDANHTGNAKYTGVQACLNIPGVYLHFYGKSITKPYRKMGHATVIDSDINVAMEKAKLIKEHLKIIT